MTVIQPKEAPPSKEKTRAALDVDRIRADFPVLQTQREGAPLIYLDNAATSQKPRQVIDAIQQYYTSQNANVHRGIHYLSELATRCYEEARIKVKHFLNIPVTCEVIFTSGTTEGINLIAQSYGRHHVGPGDEVLITAMEHHSNIVPWQILCEEKGAKLQVAPINDDGELLWDEFESLLNKRTRLVSVVHVSNALGTVNPVKQMIQAAHAAKIPVVIDGAQSAPHMPVDVQDLDCDFFLCSGHKTLGPTGIGVLYGKAELLDAMPPYQSGGDMIRSVSFEKTTYDSLPYKFEAGTPHIEGVIGLGTAIDYLSDIEMERIADYEHELLVHGTEVLEHIEGLRMIGTAREKAGVLSFILEGAHPHDIGQILDGEGIAVRAGHHCAQPVMQRFGIPATVRASLAFYNTKEELDALGKAVEKVKKVFA
jgi:cysteine desulfurase/selenocysteine lyase